MIEGPRFFEIARCYLSWAVAIGFAFLAYQYLNSALYSAWMSGTPAGITGSNSLGWTRRSYAHVSFGLSAVFFGLGFFRLIRRLPAVGHLTVVFLVTGVLFFAAPYIVRFLLIDMCLDQGGRWNYQSILCEK